MQVVMDQTWGVDTESWKEINMITHPSTQRAGHVMRDAGTIWIQRDSYANARQERSNIIIIYQQNPPTTTTKPPPYLPTPPPTSTVPPSTNTALTASPSTTPPPSTVGPPSNTHLVPSLYCKNVTPKHALISKTALISLHLATQVSRSGASRSGDALPAYARLHCSWYWSPPTPETA